MTKRNKSEVFTEEEGKRIYQEEMNGMRDKLDNLRDRQQAAFSMLEGLIEQGASEEEQNNFVKEMLLPNHIEMSTLMNLLNRIDSPTKTIDIA